MSAENDPQEKAKQWREQWRATADLAARSQSAYVNYLNDEINRLTKRVANLEKASEIVRRLAEFAADETADMADLLKVSDDAAELWDEMQLDAKGGRG